MSHADTDGPVMHVDSMAVFLNQWFSRYATARDAQARSGGYLLPYKQHFFVVEADAIRELGLDPLDPDWERIGWDWVQPRDPEAWARLVWRREVAGR